MVTLIGCGRMNKYFWASIKPSAPQYKTAGTKNLHFITGGRDNMSLFKLLTG
jgi:hypothetical protein